MNIVYIVPSIGISGGIAVVVQHANRLKKRGYDVTILNIGIDGKNINWINCDVDVINLNSPESINQLEENIDIAIATHYSTAKFLENIIADRKLYFVQSDERRFGLNMQQFIECNNSYNNNFEFFTMARWLQRWLENEFGHNAYYVPNGLDKKKFHNVAPIILKTDKKRVLIEGPISIPFKGVQDAYAAIKDMDCEIWIISSGGELPKEWHCDHFFENVDMDDMKKIYSSCDVLLKMSKVESFAYPPLEAMACGCAVVVQDVTGIEEYARNEENCYIVNGISEAKRAVGKLLKNDQDRGKMINNGYETAKQWSWDKSIDMLERVIKKENPIIHYTKSFPKVYDFEKVMNDVMITLIREYVDVEYKEKCNVKKNEDSKRKTGVYNDFIKLKNKLIFIIFSPKKCIDKYMR